MRIARTILLAGLGGFVLTAAVAVAALLVVMFTSGAEDGRRATLFGAVSFEATTDASGATIASVGIDDPVPLLVLWLCSTAFLATAALVLGALRARQRTLRQGVERAP